MEACLKLAVKVLNKTMDSTTPSPEKMEFTTITRVNGKVTFFLFSSRVKKRFGGGRERWLAFCSLFAARRHCYSISCTRCLSLVLRSDAVPPR